MSKANRKSAGRPRSLDLETLLDAAAQLDLSTVSMTGLAERLGVGVATIYRYVKDRESLVRLASARSVHVAMPEEQGQSWQDVVSGFALSTYSSMAARSELLHAYVDGHIGEELELEFADRFLEMMTRRGFSASRTMEIFQAIGFLAIGAAAASAHARARNAMSKEIEATVDAVLSERDPSELPSLRCFAASYKASAAQPDLSAAVAVLIAGIHDPED